MRSSHMSIHRHIFFICALIVSLSSCFYEHRAMDERRELIVSGNSFEASTHTHCVPGCNFVVRVDSFFLRTEIPLLASQLMDQPDSLPLYYGDELIVADIAFVPDDSVNGVWVKLAHDQTTQGWVRESELLPSVSPDDPISIAIDFFSSQHLLVTLLLVLCVLCVVIAQRLYKRKMMPESARFFRLSIPSSPYPFFLATTMAGSAVFYTSIQLFTPLTWEQFYFSPTLNPFAVPPLLGAFLFSLWAMVLFLLASIDDAFRQLSFTCATFFILFLFAVLAVLYLFFSLTTLVYLGYPLFLLFVVISFRFYFRYQRARFRCGHCGTLLHNKGYCPHCGRQNK